MAAAKTSKVMWTCGLALGVGAVLGACSTHLWPVETVSDAQEISTALENDPNSVTFAFAGDVHFEDDLADLTESPDATLGPLSRTLASADVAVVNLESAVTDRDEPTDKELEDEANRYWFRADANALDVLARSGVDAVSMANNHGADHGQAGLEDSLAAADERQFPVIGAGLDDDSAYEPFRTTVRNTEVAVFAADASKLESNDPVWSTTEGSGAGIASGRLAGATRLVGEVRKAARAGEVVAVYLHWGEEGEAQPSADQQQLARRLADAGAHIVVGSHAHVLLGSGMLDDTYVNYGLGNFLWYHGGVEETGVLKVTVRGGEVINDAWVPGAIPTDGGAPSALAGSSSDEAIAAWRQLRQRTTLAAPPGEGHDPTQVTLPAFEGDVSPIDEAVRDRMTSHREGTCPVSLDDLRYLEVSYVGFDGSSHQGEIVVNASVAEDVVDIFEQLYEARFPIQSMLLVDDFDGDDGRSMAANNTSGYNCRTVAGSDNWSNHAYGQAVDINPVQNPYVVDGVAEPTASAEYVNVDREVGSAASPGVIVDGDVVTEAFRSAGWRWGNTFPEGPDWQHFDLPR